MYPRLASNLLCSHIATKPRMILNFLVALLTLYQRTPSPPRGTQASNPCSSQISVPVPAAGTVPRSPPSPPCRLSEVRHSSKWAIGKTQPPMMSGSGRTQHPPAFKQLYWEVPSLGPPAVRGRCSACRPQEARGSPWSRTGSWSSGPRYNVLSSIIGADSWDRPPWGSSTPVSDSGPGTRPEGFRCPPSSWEGADWHCRLSPNTAVEKEKAGSETCAGLAEPGKVVTVARKANGGCNNVSVFTEETSYGPVWSIRDR